MSYPKTLLALCALALYGAAPLVRAEPPGAVSLEWDVRLRYEGVQDDALARAADAATVRLRMGLRVTPAPGWTGVL